jgi:DNA invertase Pin-like site-specific DNA recombinase
LKNVDIKIASIPNADNFQIHLYGILAAQEREFISQRVRAGMREARNRGVKFGNPKLAELNKIRKHQARIYAYEHSELIKNLRAENKTYRQICDFLNSSGIKTRTGKSFHPVQIHRILKRANEVYESEVAV